MQRTSINALYGNSTIIDEDLVMLQFINPIEYQEVVGDAFDDEVGAFEEMFGAFEEIEEMEDLSEIQNLESKFNFTEELVDINNAE